MGLFERLERKAEDEWERFARELQKKKQREETKKAFHRNEIGKLGLGEFCHRLAKTLGGSYVCYKLFDDEETNWELPGIDYNSYFHINLNTRGYSLGVGPPGLSVHYGGNPFGKKISERQYRDERFIEKLIWKAFSDPIHRSSSGGIGGRATGCGCGGSCSC